MTEITGVLTAGLLVLLVLTHGRLSARIAALLTRIEQPDVKVSLVHFDKALADAAAELDRVVTAHMLGDADGAAVAGAQRVLREQLARVPGELR